MRNIAILTAIFATAATAEGYLAIAINEGGIVEQFVAVYRCNEQEVLTTSLDGMQSGSYRILLFDIESDTGLPATNAAIDTMFFISSGNPQITGMTLTISLNVSKNSLHIIIPLFISCSDGDHTSIYTCIYNIYTFNFNLQIIHLRKYLRK